MTGGDPDVIGHLARLGIRDVGDLTQWTKLDVRTWIPNINAWGGLPHGLLSLELPQVGRILKVGQAWISYDSKGRQAKAHVRRTCQVMQLWVDGTIRYRKWTPLGEVSPFPLVQGSQLTADLSRDCGQARTGYLVLRTGSGSLA